MSRRLLTYLALAAALGVVGCFVAGAVAADPSVRWGAQVGVGCSTLCGMLGLVVKQWGLGRSIKVALGSTVGLLFGRVVVWGAGVAWARTQGSGPWPFT